MEGADLEILYFAKNMSMLTKKESIAIQLAMNKSVLSFSLALFLSSALFLTHKNQPNRIILVVRSFSPSFSCSYFPRSEALGESSFPSQKIIKTQKKSEKDELPP
jgi:hypothetical protein